MEFIYTEDQEMLADAVAKFVARGVRSTPDGLTATAGWNLLAELGVLGLLVPSEFGGMGAGAPDAMIVAKELGRGLVREPFVSTCVAGTSLVRQLGTQEQQAALLSQIAAGSTRLALAVLEPQARYDLSDVRTTATNEEDGYRLVGTKAVVVDAQAVNFFAVTARVAGRDGVTVFLLPADHPGVTVRRFATADNGECAELVLTSALLPAHSILGPLGEGAEAVSAAIDAGTAALCAEALGLMEEVCRMTADYLHTRQQFKQPLSSFQALQHRYADMLIALEQARSATFLATAGVELTDTFERSRAVSAGKYLVGKAAHFVGQHGTQLHGGVGMTDELRLGHYFKRLCCIDLTWGDADYHLSRFSAAMTAATHH